MDEVAYRVLQFCETCPTLPARFEMGMNGGCLLGGQFAISRKQKFLVRQMSYLKSHNDHQRSALLRRRIARASDLETLPSEMSRTPAISRYCRPSARRYGNIDPVQAAHAIPKASGRGAVEKRGGP